MKVKEVTAYLCGSCGAWHENSDEAEECCPNYSEETEGFECGVCNQVYESEDEAKECCK